MQANVDQKVNLQKKSNFFLENLPPFEIKIDLVD
jgi:hypothetical protein